MNQLCSVPKGFVSGEMSYVRCGLEAKYKVGNWFMCEKHKLYMADPNKWLAELLEGEENGDTDVG